MYMNVKSIQKITIIFARERKRNRKKMFEENGRIFLQLSMLYLIARRGDSLWHG